MPAPFQTLFRQHADEEGDGWRLPANDGLLDGWGLHDSDLREWVRPRLTDWSLNCFTSPLHAPTMRRENYHAATSLPTPTNARQRQPSARSPTRRRRTDVPSIASTPATTSCSRLHTSWPTSCWLASPRDTDDSRWLVISANEIREQQTLPFAIKEARVCSRNDMPVRIVLARRPKPTRCRSVERSGRPTSLPEGAERVTGARFEGTGNRHQRNEPAH